MKSRSYKVTLLHSEFNFSGLHVTRPERVFHIHGFVPTVRNVRSLISRDFPLFDIDETYSTLAEQIHGDGNLGFGLFSVSLACPPGEMFISHSVEFMEEL